ncbi:MAG: ATP-dependent dethiobiotin synthetase BioD [Acidimicrobiia bacterium]
MDDDRVSDEISRPPEGSVRTIAVVGTATEIGKTWAAIRLLSLARQAGLTVGARKCVQSFAAGDTGPTDADLLAAASGESPTMVCPEHRWYSMPYAPPMAADELGRAPIAIADLLAEMAPSNAQLTVVETAGAIHSPIAHDADCASFVHRLRPDGVLLVAHAGLGTLSDVRAAVEALHGSAVTVLLNRYDDGERLHQLNRAWLSERDGFDVVVDVAGLFEQLRPWWPARRVDGR